MSKKTFFKRISLVVVAGLGLGLMTTAPSSAAIVSNSTSLTLSASSGSVVSGETSTAITVTVQFTPGLTTDTVSVTLVNGATNAATNNTTTGGVFRITSDSANATVAYGAVTSDSITASVTPSTANAVTRASFTFQVRSATTVGTHNYTIQARLGSDQSVLASQLYTLTVSGADSSASALKSNLYINKVLPSGTTYIMSDSKLVVSAGQNSDLTLMTPSIVGYAMGNFRNEAGDSVVATNSSTNVNGTMVVKITSGPGWLSRYETATASQLVRQLSIVRGDSIVIWNDGSAGIGTITTYIGGTPLSDAADTITFYGKAEKFVATANAVTANGWNLTAGSDSVTSGTAILTFVATDAASLGVPSASQNRNTKFFLHSSDTKVVRGKQSATLGYGECTAPATAADQAAGKWSCDMFVIDSGTVTLTVTDSMTIASSLYKSNEISVTVAGAPFTGTLDFGTIAGVSKNDYTIGESALMTVTCKDRAGRTCGQPTTTGVSIDPFTWSGLDQNKQFWIGATTSTTGGISTGTATLATVKSWMAAGSTFMGGTETVVVNMPLTPGDVNIVAYTSYDSSTSNTLITKTLKVTDANVTASTDAANAANDAAAEAIDAANAATDAANLAAEAADAATVAAEEARDAADAATAAVEELATQVATLMAALKAQITTLGNTVAKIAKKVKA